MSQRVKALISMIGLYIVCSAVLSQPKPEPHKQTPPLVITEESEKVPDSGDTSDKNKNRSGVRISANYFFGTIKVQFYDTTDTWVDDVGKEDIEEMENDPNSSNALYRDYLLRLQINFMIKVGPFLAVDIGPGLMTAYQELDFLYLDSSSSLDQYQSWQIITPNISAGISFLRRFYPIKINAGLLVDINFNIFRYKSEVFYKESNSSFAFMIDDVDFAMNVSFGPRVGIEILRGSHFGFSLDFLYRYYLIKNDFSFKFFGENVNMKYRFRLPGVGIGAGVNFYF